MSFDKVALVTGASRGVGAATAVALAKQGYAVACAARATRDNPQRTPGTLDDVVDRIRAAGGTAVSVRSICPTANRSRRWWSRPSNHSADSTSWSTTPR